MEVQEFTAPERRTTRRVAVPGRAASISSSPSRLTPTSFSWFFHSGPAGSRGHPLAACSLLSPLGNTPTPLRPEEVSQILKRMEAEAPKVKVTFKPGQKVRIVDGPFNDFIGTALFQRLADPETAQCGVIASGLLIEAADPALTILITAKTAKNPMNLLD